MSESLEEFYKNLLEIDDPWKGSSINRDSKSKEVVAVISIHDGEPLVDSQIKLNNNFHKQIDNFSNKNKQIEIPEVEPRALCL
ncbi:MAG: hypothetical protein PQJ61_10890 [Spirochaetales bacterium]|uniref:Uncharacterized protein n=1 Tax=Candidatus Thalassospirochaeta sargassi TaxID=3119039 RepID=A0AAJ1MN37_9SPIO|nr:hypothetical protein [Spirochaetales bacterium]